MLKPADRSRFELVGERMFWANFAGADFPQLNVSPRVSLRDRMGTAQFTHVEIVPVWSPQNVVWSILPASLVPDLNVVAQQGSLDSTPTETVIMPCPQSVDQLYVSPNPLAGAPGADPVGALIRVYRERL